jgi:hypothetical protein
MFRIHGRSTSHCSRRSANVAAARDVSYPRNTFDIFAPQPALRVD